MFGLSVKKEIGIFFSIRRLWCTT